jgi:hypothetical protein
MTRKKKFLLAVPLGLMLLCLIAAAGSAIANQNLPEPPESSAVLTMEDQARLAEALRLKAELGNAVWPGWGDSQYPVILWNREFSFLYGAENPPEGWEAVEPADGILPVYYRQESVNPQNFAVPLGDAWAASIATKWEVDQKLISMFSEIVPDFLEPVFPFWLVIQPSETQIGGVLHEDFHVHQVSVSPQRLEQAEAAHEAGERYDARYEAMTADWKTEANLLLEALNAGEDEQARDLVRQFLEWRQQRREQHNLSAELIDYERQLEWEEGLAKYVEVASLRQAAQTEGYQPHPAAALDEQFKAYRTFNQRWSQEKIQVRSQVNYGSESVLYNTGMVQAFLLDRLLPGWKERALVEPVFLEDLLAEAVL